MSQQSSRRIFNMGSFGTCAPREHIKPSKTNVLYQPPVCPPLPPVGEALLRTLISLQLAGPAPAQPWPAELHHPPTTQPESHAGLTLQSRRGAGAESPSAQAELRLRTVLPASVHPTRGFRACCSGLTSPLRLRFGNRGARFPGRVGGGSRPRSQRDCADGMPPGTWRPAPRSYGASSRKLMDRSSTT